VGQQLFPGLCVWRPFYVNVTLRLLGQIASRISCDFWSITEKAGLPSLAPLAAISIFFPARRRGSRSCAVKRDRSGTLVNTGTINVHCCAGNWKY